MKLNLKPGMSRTAHKVYNDSGVCLGAFVGHSKANMAVFEHMVDRSNAFERCGHVDQLIDALPGTISRLKQVDAVSGSDIIQDTIQELETTLDRFEALRDGRKPKI